VDDPNGGCSPNEHPCSPDERSLYIYKDQNKDQEEENSKVGEPTDELAAPGPDLVLDVEIRQMTYNETPPAVLESEEAEPTLLSKPDWDAFCKALLWVCYGHDDLDALSERSRKELFAEAKRIVRMGYNLEDLREWFSTKWKPLKKFTTAGIRPKPFEVRERIPVVRDRQNLLSTHSEYSIPIPEPREPKAPEPGSGDDAWDLMAKQHLSENGREIVKEITVIDVYNDEDGVRVYKVDGGKRSMWIATRFVWQLERELRIILKQNVRVVVQVEEGTGAGSESAADGSDVDRARNREHNNVVPKTHEATGASRKESAAI
jgi:hypothetical protein